MSPLSSLRDFHLLLTNLYPGIKEVVTLTSDLSRKNLEKDFERMDTPQGTFYRMSTFLAPFLQPLPFPFSPANIETP